MIINIKVKPNARKQEIIKTENHYQVKLKQQAKDNKANLELIKLLRKYFKKDIKIIKGLTSRNKVVEIKDADKI